MVATVEKRVPEYMLRAREKYPRAYTPWEEDDDRLLRSLAEQGLGLPEMVEALGRGPGGIRTRLVALGLVEGETVRPAARQVGLPVPRGDWVPPWRSTDPNPRWVRETARYWGVSSESLDDALADLEEPEATVFSLCYGLPDRCAYTARAVGECLGLSAADARRLLERAEAEVVEALARTGETVAGLDLEATLARKRRRR